MSHSNDDLPLTMADLDRVRADLQQSIRHTEEMLERTEVLLMAAALLSHGKALQLMQAEERSAQREPGFAPWLKASRASTN